MQNGKKRTVAFHTLGCKLNFSESSEIGRQLENEGFERVSFGEKADVSVIHTCSVTGSADKKTRYAIRRAKQISPDGITVAMGCYAQLKSGDLSGLEDVDLVLGTSEKFDLARYLKDFNKGDRAIVEACQIDQEDKFFSAQSVGERTRAFLKVQDGCDYSCSYCTIPKARGKSRNPKIAEIFEQVESLVAKGLPEIVLTGVNTGDFGKSTGETFDQLLRELDTISGDHRFRISSIEPNLITEEIILFIKESQHFTPHFHIPLQSGSDEILKRMQRRYLRHTFEEKVKFIAHNIPDVSIGADVIVGFPGESEANFDDAFSFLSNLPLSYLHVFSYSERPGTPASEMLDKVSGFDRDLRSEKLHRLSDQLKHTFYTSQLGSERWLIPEGKAKKSLQGFTENYVETIVTGAFEIKQSKVRVKLESIDESGKVIGRII